jgi:4-amino-4-deoxy-L-arabinose transferase-like glycosyltransferase
LLIALLLVSFGLRVYRLGDKSVWFDEGWSTWLARQSTVEIAQRTARDTHPPLYFWALHLWRWGSGDGELGLRYLSVVIGVLTVAATYLLGRMVSGPKTGLLAALLVSISRFDIWWSQEIRMYALAALFATFSLWAAIRLWDRGRSVDWLLYVLFAAAGIYTLYLFALVLVVINLVWLWVLWRAEQRLKELARWTAAQLAVLLLLAPWLAYALGRIPTWSVASPVALDLFLQIYWTVLAIGIPVDVESYRWLTVPVLLIFLAGSAALLWTARRDWRAGRNAVLLLLGLLLPAGVVYLISLPREAFFYTPQLAPRYLLIFAPSFCVLLAWGLVTLGKGRHWPVAAILAAIVIAVALYGLGQYYPDRILVDDYKALAATLRAYQRPDDAVVLYTDRDWPVFAYHHAGPWQGIPNGQRMTPETSDYYLSSTWKGHEGVWLVVTPYAGINDPQGEIPSWLEARAAHVVEHRFADKVLRLYARTGERAGNARELAPGVRFPHSFEAKVDPGLRLLGYEQPVGEYQGGDTIHLFLYWKGEGGGEPGEPVLEVSLVDREGQAWKQVAVPRPTLPGAGGTVRQQVDLVVPPDAPSGPYTFALHSQAGGGALAFGRIALRQRPRVTRSPSDVAIAHPQVVDFDEGVRLLGYDIEATTLEPGDTVHLTLYWQARKPVERRYKVFTHLLGEAFNTANGNYLWGQQDNEPVNGTRATSTWHTGEVIVDRYAIGLDPGAPTGRYAIEIGLYEPATGERLLVLDGEGQILADHTILTHIKVNE